tara:strand:+ start:2186 stop:2308 length:123 start_codon:yes stop_codon:yes gene_type:complete
LRKKLEKLDKAIDVTIFALMMIGACYIGAFKRFVNTPKTE